MTVLLVDEKEDARRFLKDILSSCVPHAEVLCFDSALAALAAARQKEIDVAFIETDLAELNGRDLGTYLKELNPLVNLIFCSEQKECAFEAMQLHASGFLLKPLSKDSVLREMNSLRYPPDLKKRKRLYVQTFGNFDLFKEGKPIAFKYTRTKEIVALLVLNRGAQTTNGEIIATLWEDDGDPEKKMSYLSNLRQDLMNTFSRLGLSRVISKQRGSLAIVPNLIECDLYDWLEKKQASRYRYLGEFMNQYSWAEPMHGEIDGISAAWSV